MGKETSSTLLIMKGFVFLVICMICMMLFSVVVNARVKETFDIRGRVIDKSTRTAVAGANVMVFGMEEKRAATDANGNFVIRAVDPGIYRLAVSCVGFENLLSAEYIVSAQLPAIELELEEKANNLNMVTVQGSSLRKVKESPVSLQIIGLKEIERSPGGNRDISRIIRSYPGVSFSVSGYRNDLIVRGGAPSENRFYLDGVEIPNINHFATQGASGGAVSILNADMIREVQFYSGAFPVDKGGALSSVMDIRLRNGDTDKRSYKATLGASEFSFSGTGYVKGNTTYLFSVRQSYLQLLFKMFGLPFLPNFIDGQFKIKSRLGTHNELTLIGLAGIDDMKLNKDQTGESAEYILSYLPRIRQKTVTTGAVYKHYAGRSTQSMTLSYNYLRNENLKYRNNDESTEANKTLDMKSTEQKLALKVENRSEMDRWTLSEGVDGYYAHYYNSTFQRLFADATYVSNYLTHLGIVGWGAYLSTRYKSPDEHWTVNAGVRADGNNYTKAMSNPWKQLSPRFSVAYRFSPKWSASTGAGIFYQLPVYTSLGFKTSDGNLVNKDLDYIRVKSAHVGLEYNKDERLVFTLEGFYKYYDHAPLSVGDQIPLACKGNDYGIVGNERLVSSATGRSYGLEASLRWQIPRKLSLVSSFTLYKSEYRNAEGEDYIASAWDNRFTANIVFTYNLAHNWSIGAKVSAIGGAPYTPYDVQKSSLVAAWDAKGRSYYDYTQYNKKRLKAYAQMDVRLDKMYYFSRWMLGFYVDIQNVTKSNFREQDVLMSTGVIENPQADMAQQRYKMKYIKQQTGSLLPTIGATITF